MVALSSPATVAGGPSSTADIDDTVYAVALPYNITMFNKSSRSVQMSSNGVGSHAARTSKESLTKSQVVGLSILTNEYGNVALPYYGSSNTFTETAALPLWDDMFIFKNTTQGLYYQVDGTAPRRNTTFEFYLSHYGDATQYYHFLVIFYEAQPNIVTFRYLSVSDKGIGSTVGVESRLGMLQISDLVAMVSTD